MKVYITGNNALVFNASDAATLREKHRIVGILVGCFSCKPRQNSHLGLPLQLLNEEVALLKEKGIAELVKQGTALEVPTKHQVEEYQNHMQRVYTEQNELSFNEKMADIESRKESILAGKKAKRAKLREEGEIIEEWDNSDLKKFAAGIKPSPMPKSATYVQIPTGTWQSQSLESATWNFPSTEIEKLRCKVFINFWEQGYFITSGAKFGGDFLVYPGDPARYHSFYIAICIPPKEKVTVLHLANMGRLASTVKKTVVLCSLNENDTLTFTSLNWSHIS